MGISNSIWVMSTSSSSSSPPSITLRRFFLGMQESSFVELDSAWDKLNWTLFTVFWEIFGSLGAAFLWLNGPTLLAFSSEGVVGPFDWASLWITWARLTFCWQAIGVMLKLWFLLWGPLFALSYLHTVDSVGSVLAGPWYWVIRGRWYLFIGDSFLGAVFLSEILLDENCWIAAIF